MPVFSLADIISGDVAAGGPAGDLFKKTEKLQPVYDYSVVPPRAGAEQDDYDEEMLPASKKARKKKEKKEKKNESKRKKLKEIEERQDAESGPISIINAPYTGNSVTDQDDFEDGFKHDLGDVLKVDLRESTDEPTASESLKKQTDQFNLGLNQVNPTNNIPESAQKKKANAPSKKDPEQEKRTVFVGNLPCDTKDKALKKLFSEFGKVESVRFRNLARADEMKTKKYAAIKKDFHELKKNFNAYIRFSTEEAAKQSCQLNGTTFEGNVIRVDCALNRRHDQGRAVFLGNLGFTTHEEDVRAAFIKYGKIENVRLIRDSNTGICKGFGYINFESRDGVEAVMALDPDCITILDRKIRFSRAVRKVKQKIQPVKTKFLNKKTDANSRKKPVSFQEKMEMKKEKLKMMRLRKEQKKEASKVHSFQGDEGAGTKKTAPVEKPKKKKLTRGELKKRSMAKKFQ